VANPNQCKTHIPETKAVSIKCTPEYDPYKKIPNRNRNGLKFNSQESNTSIYHPRESSGCETEINDISGLYLCC
jgi:hypothetical protein